MTDHVHTLAECDGVGLIHYRTPDGQEVEWPVGASTCPLNKDTVETLKEHLAHHHPTCTWIGARIMTMAEWSLL